MVKAIGTLPNARSHSFLMFVTSGIPVSFQLPCTILMDEPLTVTVGLKSLTLYVAVPETSELAPEFSFRIPAPNFKLKSTGWEVLPGRGTLIWSITVGPAFCIFGRLMVKLQAERNMDVIRMMTNNLRNM